MTDVTSSLQPSNRLGLRWGIIGDGQLARMLALDAYPLGIRPVLLTADANSSAGQVCPLQVRGSVNDKTDLHALLARVDHAIIESEFVNCDALEATGMSQKVVPKVSSIRILQNKLEQKLLLQRLQISSSQLHEPKEITSLWLDKILQPGSPPVVLKFATLGYDGKGVCILNGDASDRKTAEDFCALAAERRIAVYAEDKVDFTQEAAMVAVRGASGQIAFYPLVASEQVNGICNRVMGPAKEVGIEPSFEILARKWCETIAKELDLIGVFAVEFFVTRGGSLLVNEIAPRVHNSGHYTQDAGCVSQFANHWRAVAGLALGSTKTMPFFAMQNILGPAGLFSKETPPQPAGNRDVRAHWYAKAGVSAGRKLGHLNVAVHSAAEKNDALNALKNAHAAWHEETTIKILPIPLELRP